MAVSLRSQLRIAVVDDEKMLLDVFRSLMRQLRYQADFFSEPKRALETILGNPGRYQLVMTDILMPELDGIEFARKIRFVLPRIPIVFMTGDQSKDWRQDAEGLGNIIFLEKPFSLEEALKEAIPKFLGLPV